MAGWRNGATRPRRAPGTFFSIIPALGILGILGLYSLYQLYSGLPVLMKSPPERAVGYTAVVLVVVVVITVLLSVVYLAAFPPV